MKHIRAIDNKCPICGSNNLSVTDSFTVFGYPSLIKGNEPRLTPLGDIINISFRKSTAGNRTKLLCKDCGREWEVTIKDNNIEVMTNGNNI